MLLSLISHLNSVRPIITAGALVAVSPTVFIVHSSWCVCSVLVPRRVFHAVEDAIWGWYQNFVVFVFETCLGVEIILDGSIPKEVENSIFICNHQSAMDWIVADMLAVRQGMVGNMRFVFKDVLKYVPLYGYVFGTHGGVFVKRDGSYNARKMQKTLGMLCERKVPVYLVIYPEGTRFNPKKESLTAKSQAYAVKNGLRPLKHVLTPRIKAFQSAVSTLGDYLDAVYDATIIYDQSPGVISRKADNLACRPPAPSLWDVLSGRCRRIYIKFDRIDSNDVPVMKDTEEPMFRWLHHRFEMKDSVIEKFYANVNGSKDANVGKSASVQERTPLPTAQTLLPSMALTALTTSLFCCSLGRKMYFAALFGGGIFGMVYSHLAF